MGEKRFSSEEARTRWREVLDAAAAGERVVIERYGQPVAVVTGYGAETKQVGEETVVYQTGADPQMKATLLAELKAELLAELQQTAAWQEGWLSLQREIAAEGGVLPGLTTEAIVTQLRQTREAIFAAEYAHLYR